MNPQYKKTRNYIVYTQKYSIKQYHLMLKRFAVEMKVGVPSGNIGIKWYYTIGELAQNNWSKFMNCFIAIKGDYKRIINIKAAKRKPKDSYDQWYEDSSMDGTFAYNGSANDF